MSEKNKNKWILFEDATHWEEWRYHSSTGIMLKYWKRIPQPTSKHFNENLSSLTYIFKGGECFDIYSDGEIEFSYDFSSTSWVSLKFTEALCHFSQNHYLLWIKMKLVLPTMDLSILDQKLLKKIKEFGIIAINQSDHIAPKRDSEII